MIKILFVDDHTLFRESVIPILGELDDTAIIYEAADLEDACRGLHRHPNLDLALLDLTFPDGVVWPLLDTIRSVCMSTPCVILSASENVTDIRQSLNEGCAGYLSKCCNRQELLTGLRSVLAGEVYISRKLLSLLDSEIEGNTFSAPRGSSKHPLSKRQLEVISLINEGMSNKRIARILHITEGTVKLHVSSILRSLKVSNRLEAVLEASKRGLLSKQRSVSSPVTSVTG